MKRALAKAAVQFGFGHLPGGPHLYRRLTREVLGTQAGFLTKMQTRWRPYRARWRAAGLPADARVWFHDAGWTPLMALLGWLDFGRGVTLTDHHATMQAQHLAQAVDLALDLADSPPEREAVVAPLRWAPLDTALDAIDATLHPACGARMPMADASMDLCHSGGAFAPPTPSPPSWPSAAASCDRAGWCRMWSTIAITCFTPTRAGRFTRIGPCPSRCIGSASGMRWAIITVYPQRRSSRRSRRPGWSASR